MDSLYNPLRSGSVVSGRIGDDAVVSGSIGSGQIASGHLASGFIDSLGAGISSGDVTSGLIGNNAVVSGSVASGQISWPHLANGSIRSGHYASGSIASGHMASGFIDALLGGGVGSGDIRSGMLGDAAVVSGSIASGQIGVFHLADGVGGDIHAFADEPISGGSFVYISSDGGVSKGDATDSGKIGVIGLTLDNVSSGDPVVVRQQGSARAYMSSGLTLTAGELIFLSTDGRGTNVPPSSPAHHVEAGAVLNASGYSGGNMVLAAMTVREPLEIPS